MGKFNATAPKQKTLTDNLAGGQAYKQSDELALASMLLTSFVSDQFYRGSNDTLDEMKRLLVKVDPIFAAKSAIYARDRFGMRSISHAIAGEVSSLLNGAEWGKSFYDKIVVRPDDMAEILGYYITNKTDKAKPKFPNSMKKGFAKAFDKFDDYQIAKYKMESKDIKLVDIVNIVHPIPTERNSESLSSLIKGTLKSTGTWEAKLSDAGQSASNEDELAQLKDAAWSELIENRKIGYFALLRNLRNIISQSPASVAAACEMIKDAKLISKSRVLPFRFSTAWDEIYKLGNGKEVRDVLSAINEALEISVANVPKMDGETLVVLDVSGSMMGKPSEIASLFGAILAKANSCDVMTFAEGASYKSYNPSDSVMTIRSSFRFSGGGTNFSSIFKNAKKAYDNIIILSDMQGWIGYYSPKKEYETYKKKYNANPYVYSWDLAGYGTLQLPESNVYCLAGFSEKVFDVMEMLKTDSSALVNEIKNIEF
jgi:60 kDa SS-A/Ro ribonucleoprotein